MATIDDLRQKTLPELRDEAARVRKELAAQRWELSLGRFKDTGKVGRSKKMLAQILTVITQKETLQEDKNA